MRDSARLFLLYPGQQGGAETLPRSGNLRGDGVQEARPQRFCFSANEVPRSLP